MSGDALFEARDLKITYRRGRGPLVRAVDGVDLIWRRGETLGLVGESGCGKSTLAKAMLGLERPSGGTIEFDGKPVDHDLRALRRRVQLIFQDPYQSMNPRRTIGAQVQEGLAATGLKSGDARVQKAVAALHDAGLSPADRFWQRFPSELSGGQRQRVVIAAALALEPEALVCDEPVSALDVSVRTQVLRLLADLRVSRALSLLLITHDVGLAWSMCDRVAVMYLGRIVEIGTTEQVLGNPQHPYTKALLAVAPRIEPRSGTRALLQGEPPDATAIPTGCRFHPRCPVAFDRCPVEDPYLPAAERGAACWLVPGAVPAPGSSAAVRA
jgi:oligopeptide/dipeptide ABC transporter ATP-binding protein